MSAFNFGKKICGPGLEENGCLCPKCVYFRKKKSDVPLECSPHSCIDCDPDRTEPDDGLNYGPTRECRMFAAVVEIEHMDCFMCGGKGTVEYTRSRYNGHKNGKCTACGMRFIE